MMELLRNIDHGLFHFINGVAVAEWLDPVMILLSSKWVWIPVYVLFTGLFVYHYRSSSWIVLLLAVIVISLSDSVSSKVLKPNIMRVRPNHAVNLDVRMPDRNDGHSRYGFVSSHAANAFCIFVFAGLFLRLKRRNFLLLMLVPFFISYSRVYLGVHYPADVAGGAVVGATLAWIAWLMYGRCMVWMKRTPESV